MGLHAYLGVLWQEIPISTTMIYGSFLNKFKVLTKPDFLVSLYLDCCREVHDAMYKTASQAVKAAIISIEDK